MTVFVVSFHIPYDSGGPVAVFTSKQAAEEFAKQYQAEQGWGYTEVNKFEVQG